jgi:hypothetical protein
MFSFYAETKIEGLWLYMKTFYFHLEDCMKKTKKIYFRYCILTLCLTLFSQISYSQGNKATFIRATANTYSPSLYSEKINLQILLVNLPGASSKGSNFTGSYKIYFIPEGEIERVAQSKGGVIDELNPNDISSKVLLNSGNFNKSSLGSSRLFEKTAIPFKSKVNDKSRTMLGKIVVFYSLKIYDAKLNKNIYKDSSFTYFPFERDNVNSARKTFHLSFYVNESGKLYTSSLPRDKSGTTW